MEKQFEKRKKKRGISPRLASSFGAPKATRTPDPNLRRVVLYPSELWAQKMVRWMGVEPTPSRISS